MHLPVGLSLKKLFSDVRNCCVNAVFPTPSAPTTATFFLLHCDEWDRVVALPRHKFVTGATLLQLGFTGLEGYLFIRLNRQIWYRHPNSEAGNDEIQNVNIDFYFVGITF
jgi:hypothetical protein